MNKYSTFRFLIVLFIAIMWLPTSLLAQAALVVQAVSEVNGTYAPGDSIPPVNVTIHNSGTSSAAGYIVRMVAVHSHFFNRSNIDFELARSKGPFVNAGASSTFVMNGTIPQQVAAGDYGIGVMIGNGDTDEGSGRTAHAGSVTITGAADNSFQINPGLNDAWIDPATHGQGFFITVFPDIQKMFLGWFTFEVERPSQDITAILGDPGHRWLTAFGDYSGNVATLEIELTEGGVFNSASPAPTQQADGTMTISFTDCNTAVINYHIAGAAMSTSGLIPIQRIADDNIDLCEELNTQ